MSGGDRESGGAGGGGTSRRFLIIVGTQYVLNGPSPSEKNQWNQVISF